jgi:hypothetical protein
VNGVFAVTQHDVWHHHNDELRWECADAMWNEVVVAVVDGGLTATATE